MLHFAQMCQSARGTQQQEIDDLLAEVNEEVDIDSRGATDGWTNDLSKTTVKLCFYKICPM